MPVRPNFPRIVRQADVIVAAQLNFAQNGLMAENPEKTRVFIGYRNQDAPFAVRLITDIAVAKHAARQVGESEE